MRGDNAASCVSTQPTPALLNATGHSLLRSIVDGQGAHLLAAADAIAKLERMLPGASAECRLVAVLLAVSVGDPAAPTAGADVATPAPTPAREAKARDKASQPAKASRKSKAAVPLMDISGKLLSSREIGGVAVISQAEARKALGMSCVQMIKLENQKLLSRIQESGSRHVWYRVDETQKLLNLLDRGVADPKPDADDVVTDPMA